MNTFLKHDLDTATADIHNRILQELETEIFNLITKKVGNNLLFSKRYFLSQAIYKLVKKRLQNDK